VLKLEAAKRALEGGVREVRIVGGGSPDALLLVSRAAENSAVDDTADAIPGTRVVRDSLASARTTVSVA